MERVDKISACVYLRKIEEIRDNLRKIVSLNYQITEGRNAEREFCSSVDKNETVTHLSRAEQWAS